jgi:hypothetical protein
LAEHLWRDFCHPPEFGRALPSAGERGIGEQILAHLIVERREVVLPEIEFLLGWRGIEEGEIMQECPQRRRKQMDRLLRFREADQYAAARDFVLRAGEPFPRAQ